MTRFRLAVTTCAGLMWAFSAIAAEEPSRIYECKDAKGNVVYQGDPCSEPAPLPPERPPAIRPPAQPRPPRRPTPKAAAKSPTEIAPPSGALDRRWATPETAVLTFVAALKAGDSALARSCLTSSALEALGADAAAIPMETLRETVGSFTGYASEGKVGPYWSIRALRAGMRPKWIFLEQTSRGEWKIGAF